jgi:asparagine synthase (glutamine-hydrolysing)
MERNVLGFDGRLDNYRDLAMELGLDGWGTSDSEIVLAAFRKWGEECFRRFTGDWALVLWSAHDEMLYLARDHAGTRTLYFRAEAEKVEWGTYLDTLLAGNRSLPLSKPYIVSYISGLPIRNLTPYESIHSVPPAHYVIVGKDRCTIRAHWSPVHIEETTLRSDTDYEASLLILFKQAVRRRADFTGTVLAELSGGMDSTSIVCLADRLRQSERPEAALLDTVSYFDDEEVSLDERQYFSITEKMRGKIGTHLDMAFSQRTFRSHDSAMGRYSVPGADSLSIIREKQFQEEIWCRGYRSLLSGIGGDELLGGVPDPKPELAGYLAKGDLRSLFRQAIAWSLADRSPVIGTLSSSLSHAARLYHPSSGSMPLPSWLTPTFKDFTRTAYRAHQTSRRWEYSVQQLTNERTWWAVMETLPHLFPRLLVRPEYRYPFLDKDLVHFLMGIPRAQLLRPNRRRSLMRRALVGIVPQEILERKAKAFQLRGTLHSLREAATLLDDLFRRSHLVEEGCIEPGAFQYALRKTCEGDASQMRTVIRTIAMELWLQSENTPTRDRTSPLTVSLAA